MTRSADQVLQAEFLLLRSKILDIAATLDRIDRAEGDVSASPPMLLIRNGIEILLQSGDTRAEAVQHLFSRKYDPEWRTVMQIPTSR